MLAMHDEEGNIALSSFSFRFQTVVDILPPYAFILQGLGKRVPISSFSLSKGRVGKGTIAVRLNENDSLAAAHLVGASDAVEDVLISTMNGMLIRVTVNQIAKASRYARGHRVVKLKDGDEVNVLTRIDSQD